MSEDDSDGVSDAEMLPEAIDEGLLRRVGDVPGFCLGHDMSLKGDKVMRLSCVQAGGVGVDWKVWGTWWGDALTAMSVDMASITEALFPNMRAYLQAIKGLDAAGWKAVGHFMEQSDRRAADTAGDHRAAGVMLVVSKRYPGQWSRVAKDCLGRAVAANIAVDDAII